MGFNINVTINESFYSKTNSGNYRKAVSETLKSIGTSAEEQCRIECPVRTGNLRDSHYTVFEEEVCRVLNTAEYAGDVIYGNNSRPPNDYPQRALNSLGETYSSTFTEILSQMGVLGI